MIKNRVLELINQNDISLPTLSEVITRILAMVREEGASAADLASAISKDQAISTKILKLANSAYYGLPNKVDSISRAVVVIGFSEIVGIVIGMDVFLTFSPKSPNEENGLNIKDLWRHSIGTGLALRKVAEKLEEPADESTFLCGILHDIGKAFFYVYFKEEYRNVLDEAGKNGTPLHVLETQLLGINHAEAVSLLMEKWHFPISIRESINYHHDYSSCPENSRHVAMMINLADFICYEANIGHFPNTPMTKIPDVVDELGFKTEDIQILTWQLEAENSVIDDFLSVI